MNEETPRENRMGTEHIPSLLMKMALPMMLSMLVQALYNVVDSIFVAKISEDALTALSVAFPLQNLMIAFATGLGVGINSLLSRALGEKDRQKADAAAGNGLFRLYRLCAGAVLRPVADLLRHRGRPRHHLCAHLHRHGRVLLYRHFL